MCHGRCRRIRVVLEGTRTTAALRVWLRHCQNHSCLRSGPRHNTSQFGLLVQVGARRCSARAHGGAGAQASWEPPYANLMGVKDPEKPDGLSALSLCAQQTCPHRLPPTQELWCSRSPKTSTHVPEARYVPIILRALCLMTDTPPECSRTAPCCCSQLSRRKWSGHGCLHVASTSGQSASTTYLDVQPADGPNQGRRNDQHWLA